MVVIVRVVIVVGSESFGFFFFLPAEEETRLAREKKEPVFRIWSCVTDVGCFCYRRPNNGIVGRLFLLFVRGVCTSEE